LALAQTIALLNNVPVWFELWRTLNGFPPNYYTPMTKLLKRKNNETPILVFLFCGFAVTAKKVLLKFTQISRICKKIPSISKKCQFRNQ
jgi:DMSO/TMAO reductase YedYZ heme-binding membrane subunit